MTEPLLPGTARALEVLLAEAQRRGRLPSVVAGVVRDGQPAWCGARGRAVRAGEQSRGTADTQYKIGSVTKTMTAALVLLARERGELALGDPLVRYVPDAPFPDATLRSLLSHSAGLSAEPAGEWWERSRGGDWTALATAHEGARPVLEPGGQFHYTNLGFGLLGEVAARVSGQGWWEALQEQVLTPLGMTRTSYHHQAPHAEGFAVDALTDELVPEPLPDTGAMAPAGQLWSTVTDLATWLRALVDPAASVLSEQTLRELRTPLAGAPEDRSGTSWGLGVHVVRDRGRVLVGHGGSMPGFVCGAEIDVDSRVGAVVLSNGAYGLGDLTRRLLQATLEHEPALGAEWQPASQVPDDARDVLGTWHWGHAPSRIRWTGGELVLEPVGGSGRLMAFRHAGPDTWVGTRAYLTGETLRPVRRSDGSVSHLEAATFVYTRVPYDPQAPIPGGAPGR
ncbi:serine hydrolase domain-containing protein [Nocardioides nanhaiensis]|uniref:Serine hydrolase domain-containing protein n=1 Tax=Nocardioides nanhaiensis TaxID=1476871 RepID=A0ABP8WN44_9ACTN